MKFSEYYLNKIDYGGGKLVAKRSVRNLVALV